MPWTMLPIAIYLVNILFPSHFSNEILAAKSLKEDKAKNNI